MKSKLHFTVLVFLVLLAASCTKDSYQNTDSNIPIAANAVAVEQELLGVVNEHRASLGYVALEYSAVAYEYANKHNDYMISKGSISHDNFSARATSIASQVNAEEIAENVARDYGNAQEAFQGWLSSANHKKTMEGDFSHTAVSVKMDSNGNFYFTQLFFR